MRRIKYGMAHLLRLCCLCLLAYNLSATRILALSGQELLSQWFELTTGGTHGGVYGGTQVIVFDMPCDGYILNSAAEVEVLGGSVYVDIRIHDQTASLTVNAASGTLTNPTPRIDGTVNDDAALGGGGTLVFIPKGHRIWGGFTFVCNTDSARARGMLSYICVTPTLADTTSKATTLTTSTASITDIFTAAGATITLSGTITGDATISDTFVTLRHGLSNTGTMGFDNATLTALAPDVDWMGLQLGQNVQTWGSFDSSWNWAWTIGGFTPGQEVTYTDFAARADEGALSGLFWWMRRIGVWVLIVSTGAYAFRITQKRIDELFQVPQHAGIDGGALGGTISVPSGLIYAGAIVGFSAALLAIGAAIFTGDIGGEGTPAAQVLKHPFDAQTIQDESQASGTLSATGKQAIAWAIAALGQFLDWVNRYFAWLLAIHCFCIEITVYIILAFSTLVNKGLIKIMTR